MKTTSSYCNTLTHFSRLKTREVLVGSVGIGGGNPIRIQSMTTVSTMNTNMAIKQSIKMINEGCELVRLTAPSIKEAKNLYDIKNGLLKEGYIAPLIADIHFTPNAAIEAAKIVEKVRINPGNFADKKRFQKYNYSKLEYSSELKRIEAKLSPLIETCKKHKTAIRIGTNHGSLSDRIMSQYGDTPLGMVESALEFVRICEKLDYNDIVLSMKASNPIVMMHAYRLLVNRMEQENMNYPLHLGVTEAGEGSDGRIKSAIGIGGLLLDGIGDTIRVSLTEPPENEIPVSKLIIKYIKEKENHNPVPGILKNPLSPFSYSRRVTHPIMNIGGNNNPVVIADFSFKRDIDYSDFLSIGYNYSIQLDKWNISETASDYVFLGDNDINFEKPGSLQFIYNYNKWVKHRKGHPLLSSKEYLNSTCLSDRLNLVQVYMSDLSSQLIEKILGDKTAVLLIDTHNVNGVCEQRRLFIELLNNKVLNPVIIGRLYKNLSNKKFEINASIDVGALLLDGLGDGLLFRVKDGCSDKEINRIAFNILQATRTRISKTEYISCPSCGRTQFDLEKTTAKIRSQTSHLKGLKIGVMGCIVNGPGEMADADYGYVGVGRNKVSLYKKQKVVKHNIDAQSALDELIKLIKENGDWVDKDVNSC